MSTEKDVGILNPVFLLAVEPEVSGPGPLYSWFCCGLKSSLALSEFKVVSECSPLKLWD